MTAALENTDLTAAWAEYQAIFLPLRNLAQRTRREYRTDLAQLTAFLQRTCKLSTVDQVDRKHLEAYLAELDRRGLAGSTRRRKVATTRSFFGFLQDQGATPASPARKLVPPATEQPEPRALTETYYLDLVGYPVPQSLNLEAAEELCLGVSAGRRRDVGEIATEMQRLWIGVGR
jgi:site-specific recombinase XerD